MNELDFIEALGDKSTKRDSLARELMGKLKEAGFGARELAAGIAGAGILSGIGYASMRPGKGGSPSKEQRLTTAFADSQEALKDQAERDGRPLNYREDITSAVASTSKASADVFARHPGRGALLLAPIGFGAGQVALSGLRMLKVLK